MDATEASSKLTDNEKAILALLTTRKGELVSKADIEIALYWPKEPPKTNTIEVFMGRLRKKLDATLNITTVRGRGYRLDDVMPDTEVAA